MVEPTKSRRQERVEKQKKTHRKWIATGAAAVLLLCGGGVAIANLTQSNSPAASKSPTAPAACSTTQVVNVATTDAMAKALKAMPVDAESCITLNLTTDKSATDVLASSAEGASTTNLWIPDSTVRAQLAMSETASSLEPTAESLAQSPAVVITEKDASYSTWLDVLKASDTVSMGDPKTDSAAFAALISGVSEATNGAISLEDLSAGSGNRAQTIGVTEAAQTSSQLLSAVDQGEKDSAVVTEADYAAYTQAQKDSGLKALVPADGSYALNYPLYKTSTTNTTIDQAAEQIKAFVASEEGKQALGQAGLRTAEGELVTSGQNVGQFSQLTPSNPEVLGQVWTSYSLQSAPFKSLIVLDASGSMLDPVAGTDKSRMDITVESVLAGSQLFPARDSMGLWKFSRNITTASGEVSDFEELVPVRGLEAITDGKTQRELLQEAGLSISSSIHPDDQTALYDTMLAAFRSAKDSYQAGAVNGVVILTDGQNVDDGSISQEDLISTIQAEQDPNNPIFFFLIGISEDADMASLTTIAQSVGGEAHLASSPTDIQRIFAEALTVQAADVDAAVAGQ